MNSREVPLARSFDLWLNEMVSEEHPLMATETFDIITDLVLRMRRVIRHDHMHHIMHSIVERCEDIIQTQRGEFWVDSETGKPANYMTREEVEADEGLLALDNAVRYGGVDWDNLGELQ